MKNIHVFPTNKPSKLYFWEDKLVFGRLATTPMNRNIYITSGEEIKEGDYVGYPTLKNWVPVKYLGGDLTGGEKKIILTTDQELIKDGVQAIDDEFLEWFVKNPSCKEVEVKEPLIVNVTDFGYKIIIPKEEQCTCKEHDPYCCQIHGNCPTCVKKEKPKQETPEEAAERLYPIPKGGSIWNPSGDDCIKANKQEGFIEGTKWQAERRYSEEEVLNILQEFKRYLSFGDEISQAEWFEQFKKK